MSLSSKMPGILRGWIGPGKNGIVRSTRTAKHFQRRLKRRKGQRALVKGE